MDDFDPQTFREAFLQANANQDFISGHMEYLLRTLMRGVGSQDCSPVAYKAAEQLRYIIDLVKRCPELDIVDALRDAMTGVAGENSFGDRTDREIDMAKAGLMYLVEATARDNAAKGRASKRWKNFENASHRLDAYWEAQRKRRP